MRHAAKRSHRSRSEDLRRNTHQKNDDVHVGSQHAIIRTMLSGCTGCIGSTSYGSSPMHSWLHTLLQSWLHHHAYRARSTLTM